MATLTSNRRRPDPGARLRRAWARAGAWAMIGVALIVTLVPIYFVAVASLNPTGTLSTSSFLPRAVSLVNFERLFTDPTTPFLTWLLNSLIVTVVATAITVALVATSAYGFSRLRFRGREGLLQGVLLMQVFPNILAIVALYLIVQQLGTLSPLLGLDSLGAIIAIYVGAMLGGNVWLLKGYMDTIPRDIDESAMIDGASHWRIFSRLILPLVRPMLAVAAVLTFVFAYSEVLIVQVLIRDPDQFTLPLGLYTMSIAQFTTDWGLFAAGAVLAAIPPLLIFYTLQKSLIAGLTAGAVKS